MEASIKFDINKEKQVRQTNFIFSKFQHITSKKKFFHKRFDTYRVKFVYGELEQDMLYKKGNELTFRRPQSACR
jgi:hypothetical protein